MRRKFSREQMVTAVQRLVCRNFERGIRLADVASEAGASVSTVSRYVGRARGLQDIVDEARSQSRAAERPAATPVEVSARKIELAAYYRWLNRGCSQGDALTDWLSAERSLRSVA